MRKRMRAPTKHSLGHETADQIEAFMAGRRAFVLGRPRGDHSNYSDDERLRKKWSDGWDWAKEHDGKG